MQPGEVQLETGAIPVPQESHPVPTQQFRFVRAFLEGNYFYVLSAVLMMWGCYLLMPRSILDAEQFQKRLEALLLLQGYELLVIVTALVIARRFTTLGDAFTLLVVELTLLFDPTFFSNAFFTLNTADARFVNLACLALVPVKLALLAYWLQVRLPIRVWCGLIAAAILVYFVPVGFMNPSMPVTHFSLLFALIIGVFSLVVIFPHLGTSETKEMDARERMTERQRKWLGAYLIAIPTLVAASHLVEIRMVYDIPFFPIFLVPAFLAVGFLLVRGLHAQTRDEPADKMYLSDLPLGFALLSAIPMLNQDMNTCVPQSYVPPVWLYSPAPLFGGLIGVAAIYGYLWFRTGQRCASHRAIGLAGCAILYLVYRSQLPEWIALQGMAHPTVAVWIAAALMSAIAYRFQYFPVWCLAGMGLFGAILQPLPGPLYLRIAEFGQGFFLLLVFLYYRFGDPRNEKAIAAFLVITIGLIHLAVQPGYRTAGTAGLHAVGFVFAGWYLRNPAFLFLGSAETLLLILLALYRSPVGQTPSLAAITGSLLVFGLAIAVTFQKSALMGWLDRNERISQERGGAEDDPPAPPQATSSGESLVCL